MKKIQVLSFLLLVGLTMAPLQHSFACSMYKLTLGDKTVVGCNEDAWRLTPHIWFETAKVPGQYGAAFTGSRFDGANGYAPQSGMNECGLVFTRLAAAAPERKSGRAGQQTPITNPTQYLKDILHCCKSVEEVQAYISTFDHSYFTEDVFIYVDRSGQYLVVEPYTMTLGSEPAYVLSNFCPSVTPAEEAFRLDRYRKGVTFLQTKLDTTPEFCRALSDTMHVCRDKIGDGTLLTSIWEPATGLVTLYFYHNYDSSIQFDIRQELARGDHMLSITELFPLNPEFEQLRLYKTPQNSTPLRIFLMSCGGWSLLLSLLFLIRLLRRKPRLAYAAAAWALVPLGPVMLGYMFVLCTHISIFYFPSPYRDPQNLLISLSSYLPFLLTLIIIPLLSVNFMLFRTRTWPKLYRWLFTLNNLMYFVLLVLFMYWGLYGF